MSLIIEGHSVVRFRRSVYIFGGYDHTTSTLSNSTLTFSVSTTLLTEASCPVPIERMHCTGVLPSPRCYHASAYQNGCMFICGGCTRAPFIATQPVDGSVQTCTSQNPQEEEEEADDCVSIYMLALVPAVWRRIEVPICPSPSISKGGLGVSMCNHPGRRCHGAMVALPESGALLFIGGFPLSTPHPQRRYRSALMGSESAVVFEFTPSLDACFPHERRTLGTALDGPSPGPLIWGHTALLVGDSNGNNSGAMDYDGCCNSSNRMVVCFGGVLANGRETSDVFLYDPSRWAWRSLFFKSSWQQRVRPRGRLLHAAALMTEGDEDGAIVFVGGLRRQPPSLDKKERVNAMSSFGVGQLSDAWMYTPSDGCWEELLSSWLGGGSGSPPPPRSGHAAVALDGKIFVVGGLLGAGDRQSAHLAFLAVLDVASGVWVQHAVSFAGLPKGEAGQPFSLVEPWTPVERVTQHGASETLDSSLPNATPLYADALATTSGTLVNHSPARLVKNERGSSGLVPTPKSAPRRHHFCVDDVLQSESVIHSGSVEQMGRGGKGVFQDVVLRHERKGSALLSDNIYSSGSGAPKRGGKVIHQRGDVDEDDEFTLLFNVPSAV